MYRRSAKEGFTIIEILIVLAIAGLIMLIVFLAVPALERASRNNSRKHDASLLATQRQQYDINNYVGFPSAPTSATCADDGSGSGSFGDFCQYVTQGFTYYSASEVTIVNNGLTVPTSVPTVTPDTIVTATYYVCNSTLTGATTTNADPYDAVVLYALEGPNGTQITQCLESDVVT